MEKYEYKWRFDTGPIDDDHYEGELDNFLAGVYNRSCKKIKVKFIVYKLKEDKRPKKIESKYAKVDPQRSEWFRVDIDKYKNEKYLCVIKHTGKFKNDILATIYGRNKYKKAIASATYRHTELFKSKIEKKEEKHGPLPGPFQGPITDNE